MARAAYAHTSPVEREHIDISGDFLRYRAALLPAGGEGSIPPDISLQPPEPCSLKVRANVMGRTINTPP
jgi:hypothetical protein